MLDFPSYMIFSTIVNGHQFPLITNFRVCIEVISSTTIEVATALEKYHAHVVSRVGVQANGISKRSEWNCDMVMVSARRYSLNFHGDREKLTSTYNTLRTAWSCESCEDNCQQMSFGWVSIKSSDPKETRSLQISSWWWDVTSGRNSIRANCNSIRSSLHLMRTWTASSLEVCY